MLRRGHPLEVPPMWSLRADTNLMAFSQPVNVKVQLSAEVDHDEKGGRKEKERTTSWRRHQKSDGGTIGRPEGPDWGQITLEKKVHLWPYELTPT